MCEAVARALAGFSTLYVGSTDKWCYDHVRERFNPSIDNTPYYQKLQRKTDSILFKVLNESVIKFVGAKERKKLFSFVGDTLIVDELDFCDQDNLEYAPDRMLASDDPRTRMLGNPTFPDRGIAAKYDESDQKHWNITCEQCGELQPIDFFVNVVRVKGENIYELIDEDWTESSHSDINCFCRKCNKPINRLGDGQWIAENPESEISGYHISRLFADAREDENVIADLWTRLREGMSNPERMQNLYNSHLGLPFSAGDVRIDEGVLGACALDEWHERSSLDANEKKMSQGVVAGIDVGSVLNVKISLIISGVRKSLFIGKTTWDSLPQLLKDYRVDLAVIDQKPEYAKVAEMQNRIPNLYACDFFSGERFTEPQVDHAQATVKCDRTTMLDKAFALYKQKRVALFQEYAHVDGGDFVKQMKAPVRTLVKTPSGIRYVWKEGNKADHYRFADVYEMIAQEIRHGSGEIVTWLTKKTEDSSGT